MKLSQAPTFFLHYTHARQALTVIPSSPPNLEMLFALLLLFMFFPLLLMMMYAAWNNRGRVFYIPSNFVGDQVGSNPWPSPWPNPCY